MATPLCVSCGEHPGTFPIDEVRDDDGSLIDRDARICRGCYERDLAPLEADAAQQAPAAGLEEGRRPLPIAENAPLCRDCKLPAEWPWHLSDGTVLCWSCFGKYPVQLVSSEHPDPDTVMQPCLLCGKQPARYPEEDPQWCFSCRLYRWEDTRAVRAAEREAIRAAEIQGAIERRLLAQDGSAAEWTLERRRREEAEALDERRHRERLACLADPTQPLDLGKDALVDNDPQWSNIVNAIAHMIKTGRRPTNAGVAGTLGLSGRHVSRLRRDHGHPSWEHLVARIRAGLMSQMS